MNKEDYFKYYIQGSDHYLIPKDIFDELFDEMINWKNESKQSKKVIYELEKWLKSFTTEEFNYNFLVVRVKDIFDKVNELKGVIDD
ncbi:MAG: hypothetical protein IJ501_06680 [Bacilli bacterium]|nr:hypothetical protein [Bacilli bacterium]